MAKILVTITYVLTVAGLGWFLSQVVNVLRPDIPGIYSYILIAVIFLPLEIFVGND